MDTKKLRQKVLDLAIHGKLVKQDPNDEPASVLLDRIRAEKARLVEEGKIKKSDLIEKPISEDEIPFEVPEGWEWLKVESFTYDLLYGTSTKSSAIGSVPVLRMGNITRIGTVNYSDLVYSSNQEDINKYELRYNDLLFNRTNSSDWVGKTAIFKSNAPAIYAGYLIRVRCIELCPDFINLVMNSSYHRDWCNQVKTDAVNQSNINAQKLAKHLIPIPPLAEQHRIVKAVEVLFEQIDIIERSEKELEEAAKKTWNKLLNLAIQGRLVPQDPNEEPASVLLERIRAEKARLVKEGKLKKKDIEEKPISSDEIPFDIPEGWVWTCMKDCNYYISSQEDPTKKPEQQYELYSVPTFETGLPEFVKGKDISSTKATVLKNDVLLCKINPHLNRSWIVSHYKEDLPCIASSEWIVFRNPYIYPKYLRYCFTSPYFKNLMMSNVSGVGGSLMRAQPISVAKYLFPLPPLNEQRRIVEKLEELLKEIDKLHS